jgi:hypothetical protein
VFSSEDWRDKTAKAQSHHAAEGEKKTTVPSRFFAWLRGQSLE